CGGRTGHAFLDRGRGGHGAGGIGGAQRRHGAGGQRRRGRRLHRGGRGRRHRLGRRRRQRERRRGRRRRGKRRLAHLGRHRDRLVTTDDRRGRDRLLDHVGHRHGVGDGRAGRRGGRHGAQVGFALLAKQRTVFVIEASERTLDHVRITSSRNRPGGGTRRAGQAC